MAGPVIAVTDSVFPSLDLAKAALARLNPTYRMSKSVNADDILAVAKDADAILVTYAKLTRDILSQLTKCKAIGRFGLGVDNIDLPTAKEKGIAVNYVPDYCIREVSDHTMALLLALIRKIPLSNKLVQSGRWEMPAVVPIRRIEGTVLGLVGFGHIPRLVAPKAQAFGMKVIAYDPFVKPEAFKAANVEGVDLDTLLKTADYVSMHAPLLPATRGMLNAAAFAKMKKGAYRREHRARSADRRAGADRRARCRPGRRRRARRGDGRTAGQGFAFARPRQRHPVSRTPDSIRSRRSRNCRPSARPTSRACSAAKRRSIRSAHDPRTGFRRAVRLVGDADRAAMDRLQRPSQRGLLQRAVRPRRGRGLRTDRPRAGLSRTAQALDHGRRSACALSARAEAGATRCA